MILSISSYHLKTLDSSKKSQARHRKSTYWAKRIERTCEEKRRSKESRKRQRRHGANRFAREALSNYKEKKLASEGKLFNKHRRNN